MSALVVGLSHRTAPMELLERVALGPAQIAELGADLLRREHVAEGLVLATCNRLEVLVDARTFHGALADIGDALCSATGLTRDQLMDHLYVHHDDRAVAHLFSVAAGLDSMAVGESQILGQLRDALASAQGEARVGPVLNPLLQQALRVGKRAHAETSIDQVSRSLVAMGLEHAARVLTDLQDARTVVVGAGAMSGLVVATLVRAGFSDVTVVNRSRAAALRLATAHEVGVEDWSALATLLGRAELVITGTGALGHVVTRSVLEAARTDAGRDAAPMAVLDLALPRDVEPEVVELDGVHLWGLGELSLEAEAVEEDRATRSAVEAVQEIVDEEVAGYLAQRRVAVLGPTLAALRERAAEVVEAELSRLEQRLPDLGDRDREEISRTLRRAVDKVLHTPVVRAKQLQAEGRDGDYGEALRELFDLDPYVTAAVSAVPELGPLATRGGTDASRQAARS